MFIVEFMAGFVETVMGGDNDETFDPYKARKIMHPTTYTETMIHLLKGSLGAGVLAMPNAVSRVGIIFATIGIILIGLFATYCIELLILAQYQCCKRHKRGYMAYQKSMLFAIQDGPVCFRRFARLFSFLVDTMLLLWQLGVCAIYFVFVGVTLNQVLALHGLVYTTRQLILMELPPQILLNLIRKLKLLTPLSTIANIVTFVGMMLVFFYLVEDDIKVPTDMLFLDKPGEIPVFVGMTLFGLEAVGVVLALEYNMEGPEHFVGICGLFARGMYAILAMFLFLGIPGYLKYGSQSAATITLNLPVHQKKAQVAKVSFAIALYCSIPLQNFVAYQVLWRKILKRFPMKRPILADYFLRVLLVLIPFSAAVAVPNLGGFISLMGSFCLSLLAIVFPAIMDVCIWHAHPNKYGKFKYKLWRDIFIIFFGTVCMGAGVYTSILEMTE